MVLAMQPRSASGWWPQIQRGGYHAYRGARTGILWLVGPFDRFLQLARGRTDLPPLWLRRHTGPLESYESSARDMIDLLRRVGLGQPGDRVLDVGCGTGSLIPGLLDLIGPKGEYVGLDVHAGSLAWCMRRFWQEPRCRFELARVASPYGALRDVSMSSDAFPLGPLQVDLVIAKSVFTHLMPSETRRYLAEIRRVLRPGGAAVVTAFLFESDSRTAAGRSLAFPRGSADATVRWRSDHFPWAAVAYEREHFLGLVSAAGLRAQWIYNGFLPGDADPPRGQDVLALAHAP
jgi:SAM-dependent methyltransferase